MTSHQDVHRSSHGPCICVIASRTARPYRFIDPVKCQTDWQKPIVDARQS